MIDHHGIAAEKELISHNYLARIGRFYRSSCRGI